LTGRQDKYSLVGAQDNISMAGRQDAYPVLRGAMPTKINFDFPLGDDAVIPIALTGKDGLPFDLSGGGSVVVGIKSLAYQSPPVIISKSTANSGVVITNAAAGLANLILDASDTAGLPKGPYDYDVQGRTAAGKKSTIIAGTITFTDHPTR
jgi:hypothetical protein